MTSDEQLSLLMSLGLNDPAECDVVRSALSLCASAPSSLVGQHFRRVRNRSRYLRDYSPRQIANHLRLLSELSDQALVNVAVRTADVPDELEIEVCGADVRGASAIVTGSLAELGMSILQLEVLTWDDEPEEPGTEEDLNPLSGRYLILLKAEADQGPMTAASLQDQLRQRLKAAYWHLVRGDIQKARQETDQRDELIGQTIDGRFRVDRLLGAGGMGRIYLATQLELDRPVALKVLRKELTKDAVFAANFQRESRLMAQIRSSDVVQIYAAGLHEGEGWIAMEYLSGGDVAHWISRHGVPPVSRTAHWMKQALSGLAYIHENVGIVHCDVKPANFLLDAGQGLKIGDLGLSQLQQLARLFGADGRVKGTLWYMSPEQAMGQQPDERSDLFSLGSSFYHILSGRPPFDAATPAEILTKVQRVDCTPLDEAAPSTPAALSVLIDRLMQPDPLKRYQEASVARADLESYLSRGRLHDVPNGSAFSPGSGSQFRSDSAEAAAAAQSPTTHAVTL